MEFRILGALEVLAEDHPVEIRGRMQRQLLAILLVSANRTVSADRLINRLWDDAPPPSALKTLQAHLSRLRTALEEGGGPAAATPGGLLRSTATGYLIAVRPGELDSTRFEGLVEEGRTALAAGDPARAATTLRAALELWRGPALAEFADEAFAQPEIARLEELRLAALEERVEADLACGRHAALVVELERLVEAHPFRERLRAQHMLALYRSGRQAEALQVYQQGRRVFAEELGLEPGRPLQQLERQILEQDPQLDPPLPALSRPVSPVAPARPGRRAITFVVSALVMVALVAGILVTRAAWPGDAPEAAVAIVLDPATGRVTGRVALGTTPSNVAVGEGSVWVIDADDKTISRIDPSTREVVRTFGTGSTPTDIAVGFGSLWVGDGTSPPGSYVEGGPPASISRYDPASGLVVATIELPGRSAGRRTDDIGGVSRQHIAVTHDAVWAIDSGNTVSRIDPRTNRVIATVEDVAALNIATGDGRVWVAERAGVAEIDQARHAVARRIQVTEDVLAGIAVGSGAVWAADPLGGRVWRVETQPGLEKRAYDVGTWVSGVAFGDGAVWATNEIADLVYRIDPVTDRVTEVTAATTPRDVDVGGGAVWVTSGRPPSLDADLPQAVCAEIAFDGDGAPDLLIVSDLPLKGEMRDFTRPMVDAVRLVLEQRGYEAGAFSVGYQSCDSSTAQSGISDIFRCGSNAKAYARNLDVVGVVGPVFSSCSFQQIPITNAAPGGPLAMISPSSTYDGLTDDESLYPTGTRNYVRIAAADRTGGAAQVQLVRQLGSTRTFVLTSSADDYGAAYQDDLVAAARRLGVRVVGSTVYEAEATGHDRLVREIAGAGPNSVVIIGVLSAGGVALIRELRGVLGPDIPIVAPDGFALPAELVELGGAAVEGLYITQYGVPNSHLPPRGQQFLEAFAAAGHADPGPDFAASYGAQAAEILLDAIARSDGTRASVTREVGQTVAVDGILGDIRFDRAGDLIRAPFTVYRLTDGELVVDRVVTVDRSLPGD